MTEPVYNLVFRGEVLEGQDRSAVARRLMALLKMDVPKIKALFSGQPVVLKRNVSKAVAARFQGAFRDAGARLRIAVAEPETAPAPKQTLAERLAAEEAAATEPSSAAAEAVSEPVTPAVASGRPIAQTVAANVPAGEDWSLAAEGRELLQEDERTRPDPVRVDVSHLTAAPPNSGSLEDVLPPPPPPPPAPDVSALELDAPGADLAPPRAVPVLELDLSALSLAEAGVDLAEGVDLQLPLPVPEADFDLAPVGADIETLPRKPVPPPPDTSHLNVD